MPSTAITAPQRLEQPTDLTLSLTATDGTPLAANPYAVTTAPPLTFAEAAKLYIGYIRVERGLSLDTVYGYTSWLNHFMKWLDANGYPAAPLTVFNTAVLTRFLHALHDRNLRPRTIRGVFYPLRGLGDYLIDKGYLTENPAKKVGMPKKDAAIRLLVTDAEVGEIEQATGRIRNRRRASLASAVLSVFIFAGLRRMEALGLHLGDVNTEEGSLLVRSGKGGKSRRVFPHPTAMAAIAEWLVFRTKTTEHDMLFVGVNNRPLGEGALLTLLQEVKCIAGYRDEKRICLHALRHNCATRLLRHGADIGQIQQFLGHTSLLTTQMYLHTGEENIRELASLTAISLPAIPETTRSPIASPDVQERQSGKSDSTARRFMQRRTAPRR